MIDTDSRRTLWQRGHNVCHSDPDYTLARPSMTVLPVSSHSLVLQLYALHLVLAA